ncbi:hypothetical protein Arnit_2165 [Arcobacter nitrofigilis DSM 7299]|uniref:Uncharacterized protein n=1 Tax=Arcobacter nitrofigilis (strain ATCC 33309 / DSM 7299 / CCUG 15893 / LMG 7604 / NCTC 12251 / CI) TaxID=572480 RepID=D5V0K5_ARCNC|nr:hypothetical protein [Arcobacter nitrofigilis]ADG93817.1 hypothetical protein Arnit_2165 [Arcobacter nitrofigilis DSM 7299]
MIFSKLMLILFLFLSINLFAQTKDVDKLLEKVNQASNPQEKKELIEKLKKELANKNKKAREESDAIIKAKEKMPNKFFDEKAIEQ